MGEGWWRRLAVLLRLRREEADMAEEMRFHLEMEACKLEREGWARGDARREARRRFGGEDRMKERTRDERGTRLIEDMVRDARFAVRGLRRSPGFALVAIVTVSVGVGATTAMFTLVDGVLLSPLPYPESDRLVAVWERAEDGRALHTSYLNFTDWRAASGRVDALAAFTPTRPTTVLTGSGGVRARVTSVTADFFAVGAVPPVLGRLPSADEQRPGAAPVAVVSHTFWQNALAAPPSLDDVTVDVRGTAYEVVGVMPSGFALPDSPDLWVSLDRAVPWTVRSNHVVSVLGRLAPGATVDEATGELEAAHRAIRERAPEVETVGVTVRPYLAEVVGDTDRALGLLLAASAVLLLVACTNLASTLLARGTGRARELAVRASLGAGRGRLIRQLFLESLTLALVGAIGGVLTAHGLLFLTRRMDPGAIPRLAEVAINPGVLVFTLATTIVTAVLVGLYPALSLTRGDLTGGVRAGRDGYGRGTRRVWRLIMGGEVAMALVLLVSGGLVLRSLGAILDRDGGFRTEGVVTGRVEMPLGKYESAAEVVGVLDRTLTELRSAPDVRAAGLTLLLPVPGSGTVAGRVEVDGVPTAEAFEYRVADSGYFRTLEIPLLRGRLFGEEDGPETGHVAVVDEAMSAALWPGEDALGRTFNPAGMDPWPTVPLTVIGVVGETLRWDRAPRSSPGYYVHYRQRPTFLALFGASVVMSVDDTSAGAALLRETVRRVDRDVPVEVSTLSARIALSAGDHRFSAFVLSGLALAALLLAAVGVYGVVAYSVARRTREMGIRIALGAARSQVRGTVQREALVTVVAGAVVGTGAALLVARGLGRLLFEVSPVDPSTFVGGLVVLGAAAWGASWIPAWRGTRLDPADVLRQE